MFVKFKNNVEVPIYKLRKGTIVEVDGDFYHIKHVWNTVDGLLKVKLEGADGEWEGLPKFVDWLEI